MPRRKKTQKKKNSGKKEKRRIGFGALKKMKIFGLGRRSETRFKISLVFLIAGLVFSLFLLLLTAINVQNNRVAAGPVPASLTKAGMAGSNFSRNPVLKDSSLDFTLKIPPQLGEWLYKTGYVKSPVDETLSDQYVIVYVPQGAASATNNFDDLAKNILTIRQFSQKEWDKLENGCRKGNQFYCETAGARVGEKNDKIFAYTKPESCPKSVEAKCQLADRIIKSFVLK